MAIVVVGLNQKVAPVEIREQLALSPDRIRQALMRWQDPNGHDQPLPEVAVLSTCNRLEVYAVDPNPDNALETISDFLELETNQSQVNYRRYLYTYTDEEAVRHLFSVASGLDSMILGEDQILGQVTEAMEISLECGACGKILSALFRSAAETGKRVRTETMISHGATSVSHVAVELAQRIFGTLDQCHVLLVGAHEMAEIAARTLYAYGARRISIINRTKAYGDKLAAEFNAQSFDWQDLDTAAEWADIVITATGAPHALFYLDNVQPIMARRKNRPLFFIDIAVPRNVNEAVDQLDGVYRYDIDDFESVVENSLNRRRGEIPKAEKIIAEEYQKFMGWVNSLDVVPTIIELRDRAEDIRKEELEKVLTRLSNLSQEDQSVIEMMSARIVSKLLHHPTIALKSKANQCDSLEYIAVVQELFGLNGKGKEQ